MRTVENSAEWVLFEDEWIIAQHCKYCGEKHDIKYTRNGPHIECVCMICGKWNGYAPQMNEARWGQAIKQRANMTCERCGAILNSHTAKAHHLIPVWFMPTRSLDPNNGICLCNNCHKQIHGYSGTIKEVPND